MDDLIRAESRVTHCIAGGSRTTRSCRPGTTTAAPRFMIRSTASTTMLSEGQSMVLSCSMAYRSANCMHMCRCEFVIYIRGISTAHTTSCPGCASSYNYSRVVIKSSVN